ncbi:MAG: B12-binding domain-containing radical SAM protein [Hespellia sp.]|nr:B12-binding domain-containing radical SAM protein [Hespellia sp.]
MKTLLTAINAKYIHSNLAVYSLKAYAEEHLKEKMPPEEADIELAEYTINQQADDILMDIFKKRPDLLCFSCYIWNITYVETMIVEIHKILPETIIWVGGPEVSYHAAKFLETHPEVTGVMKGEGEKTFLEVMEYYTSKSKGKSLQDIAGISYREENATEADGQNTTFPIKENPWRPVMDLSEVPFVYHHMEDFKNKIIYYETSRGCPFSCSYCLSSIDKKLRFRDIELVKRELQFFIDHEVPQVKFVDRTFNCRHEHSLAIWNYILEHDKGITNFHFEVAADLLNEEELELMATMRPGLIQLEIGIQSTNPRTIEEIHRVMNFKKAAGIVERIRRGNNIHQHLDLIAGLPYEDYESFGKSFCEVYALKPAQLQLGFLKVLKGSYIEEKLADYELAYQSRPPFEVLKTKWLPYSDVMRLKGVEDMVEVYYNSGQFEHTMEEIEQAFTTSFEMYEKLAAYYEENRLSGINHTRVARYEILLDFVRKYAPDRQARCRELLTLDLYLRENMKNRPEFAGESKVTKEENRLFYDQEDKERKYLKGYDGFDKNQLRKMTHLEKIDGQLILFDYRHRNPLNHQAGTFICAPCKIHPKSIN